MLDKTKGIDWPPNYTEVCRDRYDRLTVLKSGKDAIIGAKGYYADKPIEFIEHWCDTFDPRNAGTENSTRVPFILFPRQKQFVEFLHACVVGETNGLVEKCRDMGATWICCAFSVWLWLFTPGASIGWGSRKEQLVDRLGDADSIFEKMRIIVDHLPLELLPAGFSRSEHMTYMRFVNPENGSTITGESGDNIGRGGRKLIYFKDESAHYERPESIEAALTDNTRIQIDISSVNGLGNVFHRRRESGVEWEGGRATADKTNVFILDWRDHPLKTYDWHAKRKRKAEDEGLLHLFYQEVERNYAAAVEGIVIPAEWVESAIDAHLKIPKMDEGGWAAGLDVADSIAGDRNAICKRKGVVLRHIEEWGERDTGVTTRRAAEACIDHHGIEIQYDCIGVGAGVKAEANRLEDENLMPRGMRFVPWNAGAPVLYPDGRVIEDDKDSPINKDFYQNLKAQGWWNLRRRFEKTHRAITEKIKYPLDELISLPSDLPKLRQLQKELSQPTITRSSRMRLMIEKMPEGMRSPNLADAVVMCYFPATEFHYDATLSWVG